MSQYGTGAVTSAREDSLSIWTLMSKGREIRCSDYVNHPYEHVRDALRQDALTVFQSATKAATAGRNRSLLNCTSTLPVLESSPIKISVKNVEEKVLDVMPTPTTWLVLEWEATTMPSLFPLMKGELPIYPLTASETQLDFLGFLRTTI